VDKILNYCPHGGRIEIRIGAAPVCAKSTRKVFRVLWGALAMSGDGDGDEPWSDADLCDLDSTLSFGANIEEIALFLRREVEDVERKAFERSRPSSANPGLTTPNRLNPLSLVRAEDDQRSTGGRLDSAPR
jgi:hypothetical protein